MIVLVVLVAAGFVSRRLGLMDAEFDRKLSNFVMLVSAPCLILSSTMGGELPDRSHILPLAGIGIVTYIILIGLGCLLPRFMPVKEDERGMYRFMLSYPNVGFIGFPIVASIFGNHAIFYASLLNIPNTVTIFVFGTMFVSGARLGRFNWRLLYSPFMVATYISIVIVALGLHTPDVVAKPVTLLGGMTVPSALLVIGSSIASMPLKKVMGSRGTYVMCVLRLLVLPVVVLGVLRLMHVDPYIAGIDMVLAGMPVASFGTMFCLKYGKDETAMSQGTFFSTLLSVISIPLLTIVLSM